MKLNLSLKGIGDTRRKPLNTRTGGATASEPFCAKGIFAKLKVPDAEDRQRC